jgi:hypothetical protein
MDDRSGAQQSRLGRRAVFRVPGKPPRPGSVPPAQAGQLVTLRSQVGAQASADEACRSGENDLHASPNLSNAKRITPHPCQLRDSLHRKPPPHYEFGRL